jgi:hypothetical protein
VGGGYRDGEYRVREGDMGIKDMGMGKGKGKLGKGMWERGWRWR